MALVDVLLTLCGGIATAALGLGLRASMRMGQLVEQAANTDRAAIRNAVSISDHINQDSIHRSAEREEDMLRRMSAIEVTVEAIRAKGDEDARRIMQALMEIKVDLARMSK